MHSTLKEGNHGCTASLRRRRRKLVPHICSAVAYLLSRPRPRAPSCDMKLSRLWSTEQRAHASLDKEDLEACSAAPGISSFILTHILANVRNMTDDEVREFISAVSGTFIATNHELTPVQSTYINYIRRQVTVARLAEFKVILENPGQQAEQGFVEILRLLRNIAQTIQAESDFSIDEALQKSVDAGILSRTVLQDSNTRDKARNILFCCIAWICMLYPPIWELKPPVESLSVDKTECDCIAKSQPISNAARPLYELVQDFGPLLPGKMNQVAVTPSTNPTFSSESLYISLLNASILANVGGIQIQWISHLSSHLTFDVERRKLFIFAHPSFCEVGSDAKSVLSGFVTHVSYTEQ